MADEPTNQQSISDDQELAKVLAGVSQEADSATEVSTEAEDTQTSLPAPTAVADDSTQDGSATADEPASVQTDTVVQ